MSTELLKIQAPKINAIDLWQFSGHDFNNWRKKHDFPRIVSFLKKRLPKFIDWMESQNLSDEILIEHFPASFLKEQKEIYLYQVLDENKNKFEMLLTDRYKIGQTIFHKKLIQKKTKIIPYPNWIYNKYPTIKLLNMHIGLSQGRSHYFMKELELIDLGNCRLSDNYFFDGKNLDFVNLDDVKINRARNNSHLRIWFSSAVNMEINGDLHFIDAYKTIFYDVWDSKYSNLILKNGMFQNWSLTECDIQLNALNSTLFRWNIDGYNFKGVLNLCDIQESTFISNSIKYPIDLGRAKDFHKHVKFLYSQLGNKKEASKHYYLEKTYQRKSYLKFKSNYRDEIRKLNIDKIVLFPFLYIKYYFKYLISSIMNILWGYGEKPKRVLYISGFTIMFFAILFYYYPNSATETKGDIINSIYFSLVTFSTLGSSDIIQTDCTLRLLSGLESILGVSFWGILIAGFSNNVKDY